MRFALSTILATLISADLLWWWRAHVRARMWPNSLRWQLFIGLFVGGQIALVLWMFVAPLFVAPPWQRPPESLTAAAFLWHLIILPPTLILMAVGAALTWAWQRRSQTSFSKEGSRPAPTRRQFINAVATAAPVLLTGAGAAYSRNQVREFRIRPMDVPLATLPPELDGLKIALVADMHVGTFTHGPTVKRIVDATNRLDADLVLLPGDLINNHLSDLSNALDAVGAMQSRHGAFLCVGNHDLIENGAEFVRRVKARATLLVNENRTVTVRGRQVQLLGLPWSRDEQMIANSVRKMSSQIVREAFPILLAHHPHAFDEAAATGIPLTVSGHTHGGQFMLSHSTGFGPMMYRYWSGLYHKREQGGSALVVSNGVGNWFPVRVGAPAEIVAITLRKW